MSGKTFLNRRMVMRSIVVEPQVDVQVFGNVLMNGAHEDDPQEGEELLMAMAPSEVREYIAGCAQAPDTASSHRRNTPRRALSAD